MALRKVAPTLFRRAPDDEAAFERLYERHVEGVYRYSLAMLGDAADAEDVTQTTFLNAYRAYKNGTRPDKPQSWLIAIAHNVCRQRFRQAQRRPREVAFDEGIGDAEAAEPTGPTAEELRRALSQLPPNQRAALIMRELEGGSYTEIAKVLGISVSALETLLFRARRTLREQLEEQISCQEAALAINRQLDGRLSMGERRALRAHLRACGDCHSLAQSQRAQRRVLKSLVLVPLPLTIAHWSGAQSASAATGAGGLAAVGATTGGAGAGASAIALGGVAAKVAAVVAAGVVVAGGTYEGVKHVSPANALPKADAAAAPAARRGLPIASARTFETPKVAAPVRKAFVAASTHASTAKTHAGTHGRSTSRHATHVPPGQTVKAVAKKDPHALRKNPPGHTVSAAHAAQPPAGSHAAAHSKAVTHSRPATKPQTPTHSPATHAKPAQSATHAKAPAHRKDPAHAKAATHTKAQTTPTDTTATETTLTETTPTQTTDPAPVATSKGASGSAPRGKP
ncbi:MAG: sigma-70 family RNA polymerase sigma factor [Gaiellaceae bacterium]